MTALHVLVVGSAPVSAQLLMSTAVLADLIVCADGGAEAVMGAAIVPAAVLGDMDSISPNTRARMQEAGVHMVEFPVSKDKTDLEISLDFALSEGADRITVVGALGGARLDHTLGNVMLLSLPVFRPVDLRMLDEAGEALVVWDSRTIVGEAGDYVSLMPLTPSVDAVSTSGLRYALSRDALFQGSTRGISNEMVDHEASISVGSGLPPRPARVETLSRATPVSPICYPGT